jgi:hypothetical protein
MRIPSFVKLPKHRTFNYVPRYYNPQKEELNKIIRNAELGIPQKQANKQKNINYYFSQKRAGNKQTLLLRIIVFSTIILMLVALYYIFDVIKFVF